jgi:hypothetical protein
LRARDTPVFGKAPIVPPVRLSGDQIIPCWKPYALSLATAKDFMMQGGETLTSMPVRFTSYHYCYDNLVMQAMLAPIQMYLGKQIRTRLRPHHGSSIEINYSLLTFGIHCQGLIRDDGGNDDERGTYLHTEFLKRSRECEEDRERNILEQEAASGIVLYPGQKDVLVGRGHPYQEYCGNRRLQQLIDSELDRYKESTGRFTKMCISMGIVKTIQDSDGRFLSPTEGGWKVLDDTVVREKISVAFRSRKASKAKQQEVDASQMQGGRSKKRLKMDSSALAYQAHPREDDDRPTL